MCASFLHVPSVCSLTISWPKIGSIFEELEGLCHSLDEQREQRLIAEQISHAAAEDDSKTSDLSTPPLEEGLRRDETSEKIVFCKACGSPCPLKANPIKWPSDVFRSSRPPPMIAAERLIVEGAVLNSWACGVSVTLLAANNSAGCGINPKCNAGS